MPGLGISDNTSISWDDLMQDFEGDLSSHIEEEHVTELLETGSVTIEKGGHYYELELKAKRFPAEDEEPEPDFEDRGPPA